MTRTYDPSQTRVLDGRVGVVAGCGPGIGRSVALGLALAGADIVLAARTPASIDPVAREVESLGRKVLRVPTDITVPEECLALADATREAFGRADVLVNNAIRSNSYLLMEALDMSEWQDVFAVNVFGPVQTTLAFVPLMRENGGGSVVMMSSLVVRRIVPYFGPYTSAKSAVMAAAQVLAKELGVDGIRVNSLLPGYVLTPATEAYFEEAAEAGGTTVKAVRDAAASETALLRLVHPDDVANAVVFLASDHAAAITGQALDVNSGHAFH